MPYYLMMQNGATNKKTISFRLEREKVAALDKLAKAQTRDRTFLLNEAVDAYLEVQRWQIEHIREGLRQADAGMGADHEEVRAKWRRRRR
ncbi:MAG TPA: CopG family transcriptional regulator [Terriglobia bacterium]|nr:CopG family transcriptional regulator [Terriglobia bacterium]